jgi:glutamyl-Q tRNA(Asp) synthetase
LPEAGPPASFIMSVTPSVDPSATPLKLDNTRYRGRFAPSPSGPLHFGSLVSALASYLDAKANHGQWLVRMEDLDPPREQPGAASLILQTLEDHGLQWDEQVLYQSARHQSYQETLEWLIAQNLAYPCSCSRQELAAMGGIYDGRCRHREVDLAKPYATRLKLYDIPHRPQNDWMSFNDVIQGQQTQNLRTQAGDQILKRRDGFYAYQLAVVVDDIHQQITHIIRGSDLLEVTARQLSLFNLLDAPTPAFGHVPLALQSNGQKLSKQNHAKAIDSAQASRNLWHGLGFLGQNPPVDLARASTRELLSWAQTHWRRHVITGLGHLYQEE